MTRFAIQRYPSDYRHSWYTLVSIRLPTATASYLMIASTSDIPKASTFRGKPGVIEVVLSLRGK